MRFVGLALVAALVAGGAQAATIYDSGPGCCDSPINGPSGPGLNVRQSLAAKLTLGSDAVLSDIEAQVGAQLLLQDGTSFTIGVSDDDGGTVGDEIFSTSVAAPGMGVSGYYGGHSLGWNLTAGSYWFTFMVRPGQTFSGVVFQDAPNPVGNYAFHNETGDWMGAGPINLAFRILGDGGTPVDLGEPPTAPVPEPAAWAVMLMGFGAAGARLRRRIPVSVGTSPGTDRGPRG